MERQRLARSKSKALRKICQFGSINEVLRLFEVSRNCAPGRERTKTTAIVCLVILALGCGQQSEESHSSLELLDLILLQPNKEGKYTIVKPKTQLYRYDLTDEDEVREVKEFINKKLIIPDYDLTALLDDLFQANKKSVFLSLESDVSKGYVIDKTGKFDKYFQEDVLMQEAWERLYKDHPKAHGITTVSIPAFDNERRIILVYKGTQTHSLQGGGWLIAYRLGDGKLTELGRVLLWIS